MTLTIHKHLIFTLRVWNTCNKGVQDLSQGVKKKVFKNKLKYYELVYPLTKCTLLVMGRSRMV